MPEIEDSKPFKKQLPVDLSDVEMKKKGQKAGRIQKELTKIRAGMNDAVKGHRADLKEKTGQLNVLLADLDKGTEDRTVECVERRNYTTKRAVTVRLDTGADVESRTLSPEESQRDLYGDDAGVPSVSDVPADKPAKAKKSRKKG